MEASNFIMRTITFQTKLNLAEENSKIVKLSSIASEDTLKDLRKLLPDQEEMDESSDLIYFSANAAVLGLINANGAGMGIDLGVETAKRYEKRPVNWGHDRYTNVGYISHVAFSTFGENKLITAEEALQTSICNVVVSGLLWKVAAGGLAENVDMCDNPGSYYDKYLSVSWEWQFEEYGIALGSKNLSRAQIITEPDEVAKYTPYLREDGGSGFLDDGTEVYLVITDKAARCLGIGITPSPAAPVKGIVTKASEEPKSDLSSLAEKLDSHNDDLKKINEILFSIAEKVTNQEENQKNIENNSKSISQKPKGHVIQYKSMNSFKTKEEVREFLSTASTPENTKQIFDFFEAEYAKAAEDYANKKVAEHEASTQAAQEVANEKAKVAKLEEQLADIKAQFADVAAAVEAEKRQQILDNRVSSLAEEFDLSDEKVKRFVVKQIADLDETAYASWLDEASAFLKPKKTEVVDPKEASAAVKEAKATVDPLPNSADINPNQNDYSSLEVIDLLTLHKQ